MALPRALKNFNVRHQGISHLGEVQEISLPKLARKLEKFRGGGMLGEVEIDLGQESLEMESTYAGYMRSILAEYGIFTLSGVMTSFHGAYQRDDTGEVDSVDIITLGRHVEIDRGKAQAGDKTEFKVKTALTYYYEVVNGFPLIEIDMVNGVFNVAGVPVNAAIRNALNL